MEKSLTVAVPMMLDKKEIDAEAFSVVVEVSRIFSTLKDGLHRVQLNNDEDSTCVVQDFDSDDRMIKIADTNVDGLLCYEDNIDSFYVDEEGLLLDEYEQQNVLVGCNDHDGNLQGVKELFQQNSAGFNETYSLGLQDTKQNKINLQGDPSVDIHIEEGIPCPDAEKVTPFGQSERMPEEEAISIVLLGIAIENPDPQSLLDSLGLKLVSRLGKELKVDITPKIYIRKKKKVERDSRD